MKAELKNIKHTSHTIALSKGVLFWQKEMLINFLQNNVNISKIERILVLKGIFSKTTYVSVLTYQISSF